MVVGLNIDCHALVQSGQMSEQEMLLVCPNTKVAEASDATRSGPYLSRSTCGRYTSVDRSLCQSTGKPP